MRGWPTLLLILLLGETSSHRPDVRANRPALSVTVPEPMGRANCEFAIETAWLNSSPQPGSASPSSRTWRSGLCGESRSPSESQDLRPASARRHCWGAAALALEEARAAGGSQVAVRPRRRPGAGRLSVRSPPGGL